MNKLGQKGFAHILLVLIMLAGIVAGVYLVQNTTKLFPKATVSGPVTPTTSFVLAPSKSSYQMGEEIQVDVIFHTDIAPANLFAVRLNYDPGVLKLAGFSQIPSPSYQWIEMHVIDPGKASFVVGVPNPGIQTQTSDNLYLVRLRFTALKSGKTTISFDDTSAIYSNADNANILAVKEPGTVVITDTIPSAPPTPQPSAFPTPTGDPSPCLMLQQRIEAGMWSTCGDTNYDPIADANKDRYVNGLDTSFLIPRTDGLKDQAACVKYLGERANPCLNTPVPSTSPVPGNGDGNKDGKVDLIDLSILLTDFNKNSGIRTSIDLNGDGVVNTFDFSLMRNLLIEKGVIKADF